MVRPEQVFEGADDGYLNVVGPSFNPSRDVAFPRRRIDVTGGLAVDSHFGDAAMPICHRDEELAANVAYFEAFPVVHPVAIEGFALAIPTEPVAATQGEGLLGDNDESFIRWPSRKIPQQVGRL